MKKILFVDDEPNILAAYQRQLRKQFSVEIAVGPVAGLAALQNPRDFAVVVADMRMPEMNGVEFLVRVKTAAPETVRMMLTGNADQATAIDAINEGSIFRFLNKPCPPETLVQALEAALHQHQLITAERELLENTLSGSIKVLADILAMVEPKSFGRAEILRDKIRRLAGFMNITPSWDLEAAALLAHIGTVTVPPEIILKARVGHTLSFPEQELLKRIPAIGGNLLSHIPRLEQVSRIISYQNKRFDGSGFPEDSVAGADIPLGARMIKVLFDLDQLESKDTSPTAALEQMRARPGWYDVKVLDAVATCFNITPIEPANTIVLPLTVSFAELRVGHVLVSDIVTKDDILIVAAGNHITQPLIQRLRNFASFSGIKEPIHVEP
jgi:response regulator RpfG family c-di-GMP phosphodiesterase